jgi:hypothetical protein
MTQFDDEEVFDSGLDEIERQKDTDYMKRIRNDLRVKYPDIATQFDEMRNNVHTRLDPNVVDKYDVLNGLMLGLDLFITIAALYFSFVLGSWYLFVCGIGWSVIFIDMCSDTANIYRRIGSTMKIGDCMFTGMVDHMEMLALMKADELGVRDENITAFFTNYY